MQASKSVTCTSELPCSELLSRHVPFWCWPGGIALFMLQLEISLLHFSVRQAGLCYMSISQARISQTIKLYFLLFST